MKPILLNEEKLAIWLNLVYKPNGMDTRAILMEVAENLPPDATLADAIYELEFRQAVEDGPAELDRGETVSIEQIKAKISQWAGKS
jgi:predicted transcriptional regulator